MSEDNDIAWAKLVSYPPEEIWDYTVKDIAENGEGITFFLPYQWTRGDGIGNPRPDDPLTIYWSADVSGGDDRLTYKTTIGNLLDDTFDLHQLWNTDSDVIGTDSVPLFTDIRDALQKEIDRLNAWISSALPSRSEI